MAEDCCTAGIDKMQRVRLRRIESYKVESEWPFKLHHHINECDISLNKDYQRIISFIERGHETLASQTFIPTNLDPSIPWSLPRWELRHQILQDLIDAIRNIISRVPPFFGGKRPKNNAAQEPSHTFETIFRHETCLPAN